MPEHTSFFSYLIAMFPALGENMQRLGHSALRQAGRRAHGRAGRGGLFVAITVICARARDPRADCGLERRSCRTTSSRLRTFFEVFIGYFYDLMKDMMGAKRAKRYFPIIGTVRLLHLLRQPPRARPRLHPADVVARTSRRAARIVVFLRSTTTASRRTASATSSTSRARSGGCAWLIFPLEVMSLCIRPITLCDPSHAQHGGRPPARHHRLGMFALILPIPIMILGTLVVRRAGGGVLPAVVDLHRARDRARRARPRRRAHTGRARSPAHACRRPRTEPRSTSRPAENRLSAPAALTVASRDRGHGTRRSSRRCRSRRSLVSSALAATS